MSLNVKLRLNNYFHTALLLFVTFSMTSCKTSPHLANTVVNNIDQQYKLSRINIINVPVEKGAVIELYKTILSKTLSSRCKWFPSDSAYTSLMQKKCGALRGTIAGVSRFLTEEDAAYMGYPVVNIHNKLHYLDLPDACLL